MVNGGDKETQDADKETHDAEVGNGIDIIMSIDYSVSCRTCKITRSLGSFYISDSHDVETRKQAFDYEVKIKQYAFKSGLLVSFMGKHMGHDCVLFSENTVDEELDYVEIGKYEQDHDFL